MTTNTEYRLYAMLGVDRPEGRSLNDREKIELLRSALETLLDTANRYSDEMREIGRGCNQLGEDADSVSVAGMARGALSITR